MKGAFWVSVDQYFAMDPNLRIYKLCSVSLKTKLAAIDLHRLLRDVRRRVEHEITFEGNEKRTTYVSPLCYSQDL